jgi:hypothetical protein
MSNPKQALRPFLKKYSQEDVEYILWHMIRNAVGCQYVKAHIRLTMMDFYEDLLKTFSGIYPPDGKQAK